MLETAQNEAELAAVMAHETGHVVARHAARTMVVAYGLDAMTSLAAGKNPALAAQLTSSIAGKGVLLAHSRADETEADEYGARYASSAGYDPHAFPTFFSGCSKSKVRSPDAFRERTCPITRPRAIASRTSTSSSRRSTSRAGP